MPDLKILHKVVLRAARTPGQVYVKDDRIWQKAGGYGGVPTIQATPTGRDLIRWGYLAEHPSTGYLIPTAAGQAWLDEDDQRDNSVQHRSRQ